MEWFVIYCGDCVLVELFLLVRGLCSGGIVCQIRSCLQTV